jgi:hypothetical protein
MNRLNQAEPATFSILPFWTYFWYSYFPYFVVKNADINDILKLVDVVMNSCSLKTVNIKNLNIKCRGSAQPGRQYHGNLGLK